MDLHYRVGPPTALHYLFRGQADEQWSLEPTLTRELRGFDIREYLDVERVCLQEFRSQAYAHIPQQYLKEEDLLSWWTIMRHYGAPTRLLDWSASPYIALYFAVENKAHWHVNGAVWCYHPYSLAKRMRELHPDYAAPNPPEASTLRLPEPWFHATEPPKCIYSFTRQVNTDRMIAQQGQYSVCLEPLVHQDLVIDAAHQANEFGRYLKVVVPAALKPEFLHRLRPMNISANSLFPGIDGVGLSIAEMARLHGSSYKPGEALRSYFARVDMARANRFGKGE